MPKLRSLVGAAVFAAALTLILQLPAAAQTSIDTPTGSITPDQCGALAQPVVTRAPSSDLSLFFDGLRSGASVWLGSWPAAVVVERAMSMVMASSAPILAVWQKSAR